MKTTELLERWGVEFDVVQHEKAGTSARVARVLPVPGRALAKTVLVRADHGFRDVVAIVPADRRVDLPKLSRLLGRAEVELGDEQDIVRHCPDCERGVLPPFGSQFNMETVVDEQLAQREEFLFEGDTHHDVVRMRFADFRRVESPLIGPISARTDRIC